MKILFYNWDRIDGKVGGGVNVYQINLFKYLINNSEHEIYFINSGYTYTKDKKTVLKKIHNSISDKIKSFEIINSPVIAPAQQSIKNLRYYLEDMTLYELFKKFIEDNGGFDVIHFNNLEGISINVLKLKEIFPQTKFIFSVHNYFIICSKVSLWQTPNEGANRNCIKKSAVECAQCYKKINYGVEIFSRRYFEKVKKIKGVGRLLKLYTKLSPDRDDIDLYREFEEKNLLYADKYFDKILAVSKRVKEIVIQHGINEKKVEVSYIGTDVAEIQIYKNCADIYSNPFKIIFLGYMNEEKGFFFLQRALEQMKEETAKNIEITVAAKYTPRNIMDIMKLEKLKGKFKEIKLQNGYKRAEQKKLLEGQHLAIVPIMWEDNLPQTAMEQIAYGVPILCSNLGGASELHSHNENFTFEAGNIEQFLEKFEKIYNERNLLKEYWRSVKALTTMKEHVKFLEKIYKN